MNILVYILLIVLFYSLISLIPPWGLGQISGISGLFFPFGYYI